MNKNATFLKKVTITGAMMLCAAVGGNTVLAQQNVASASQGTIIAQSGGGTGAYGPEKYINDTLLVIGAATPVTDQGYVSNNGWIEFTFPAPVSVNKVVFFKEARPVTTALIEAYDATSSSYVTVANYENYVNVEEDSIVFAAVTTDKIRINNIIGHSNNPNFREIKIISAPAAACSGAPTVSAAQATYVANAGTPMYLQNNYSTTVTTCPGATIHLSAYNLPFSTGLSYQWNKGGSPVSGATNSTYTFEAFATSSYTVTVSCGTNTTTSNAVNVTVTAPIYNPIPYTQTFESWSSSTCVSAPNSNDLPGTGWANNPAFGNSSWRRSNQGTGSPVINEASWTSPATGNYNTPVTPTSGLGPGWPTTGTSARFHSVNSLIFNPGNLDLFLNCSGSTGNKALYFYHMNKASAMNDSLIVYLSTDNGESFTRMAGWDTAISWRRRWVPIASTSPQTIVRFQATKRGNENTDIGIDSVMVVGPCSGTPVAGTIAFATTTTTCAGASYTLTVNGATTAGDLVYQWEYSNNAGVTWTPVGSSCGAGADGLFFTTPHLYDTVSYRMGVKCGTGGTFAYTSPVTFNVAAPSYAAIPFSENFNSTWTSLNTGTTCGTRSLPSVHFANYPATNGSNNSWRRNDDGLPGGGNWTNPNNGVYNPTGITGQTGDFSARFHSAASPITMNGKLDLLLDCSSATGDKEVEFGYINTNGNDSLQVFYSEDAGCSFVHLNTYYTTPGWEMKSVIVPTNSPQTIIRFQAHGDNGTSDIGLDSLRVIPPCNGIPTAGDIISDPEPCAGVNFTMSLSGATQAAGLTYQWYKSDGTMPYAPIFGATNTYFTTNIQVTTFFYVVVTCNNSAVTDTTSVFQMNVAPFYHCYCISNSTTPAGADIGNVRVVSLPGNVPKLNNGTATPLNNNPNATAVYTDYRLAVPPTVMYLDSIYAVYVTQINSGVFTSSTVSVWIDTNRDGYFDPGEKFLHEYTSSTSNPEQRVQDTFQMLVTAQAGITGMRVVLEQGSNPDPVPCGIYTGGETEDYLVDIRFPSCNGPADAGTAYISDTSGCVGYFITVMDTTHERERSDIQWLWQYSPDGNSWAEVAGSQGRDTIEHIVTGPVHFRLRMICFQTMDTTFSNEVSLSVNPAVSCYCFSQAIGGALDSSDIGGFKLNATLDSINISSGGPHLMNAAASRGRTDYTRIATPELWIDSTYTFQVSHIMRSTIHADAKITLFIDFNADLDYDIPQERVWTTQTSAGYFVATTQIQIPQWAIPDVPTGMRLILNNNVDPNIPSDEACGTYTSGETEDYVVIFRSPITGVNTVRNVSWINVYPNPTEGKFSVSFVALKEVDAVKINVSNVTGQQIMEQQYEKTGKQFSQEFDISGIAKGVYFVEIIADNERQVKKLILR